MSLLLIVALSSLCVVVLTLLVLVLRHKPPVDVEGWHRRLRILRDTAQPDAAGTSAEMMVAETADRNVRIVRAPREDGEVERAEPGTGTAPGEATGNGEPSSGQVTAKEKGKAADRESH